MLATDSGRPVTQSAANAADQGQRNIAHDDQRQDRGTIAVLQGPGRSATTRRVRGPRMRPSRIFVSLVGAFERRVVSLREGPWRPGRFRISAMICARSRVARQCWHTPQCAAGRLHGESGWARPPPECVRRVKAARVRKGCRPRGPQEPAVERSASDRRITTSKPAVAFGQPPETRCDRSTCLPGARVSAAGVTP